MPDKGLLAGERREAVFRVLGTGNPAVADGSAGGAAAGRWAIGGVAVASILGSGAINLKGLLGSALVAVVDAFKPGGGVVALGWDGGGAEGRREETGAGAEARSGEATRII